MNKLTEKLCREKRLEHSEWVELIKGHTRRDADDAKELAVKIRKQIYGNDVYIRGLTEISNYCRNNCSYCGIRRGNRNALRYRLEKDEIVSCCKKGYDLGFRTFVLQGGEDMYFDDEYLCEAIGEIKRLYPNCAVTLSIGERSKESYKRLFEAGADRYLLRHETADKAYYEKLHPSEMSYDNRMECLKNLKEIGFQTGCGFMVGAPGQTSEILAKDMAFLSEFKPEMVGIGPFVSHCDTIYASCENGSADLTVFLLSLIRIMLPNVLLPSTTALATVSADGRKRGIEAGANVVMPNLSPAEVRAKYLLYNNKASVGTEAAEGLDLLKKEMNDIGYRVVTARGDFKKSSS